MSEIKTDITNRTAGIKSAKKPDVTKTLKVLMIDPWIGNDYSFFLCTNLSNHGVNVSLIVNEDRAANRQNFELIRILPSKQKSHSVLKKLWKYFAYLGTLHKMTKSGRYNIIHFQAFRRRRMESLFFYFLSLGKNKLVYTVHDVDPLDWSRMDQYLNNIIYRAATSLIAHSQTNKNLLMQKYKVADKKVSIVPHGSFENSYPGKSISTSEARRKLDLKDKDNVILFFGAVKEYKGIDILLDACEEASRKIPDLVLVIAGKAEHSALEQVYLEKIKNINAPLKVVKHFNFIDTQDVETYFKAADAAVLPYKIISHSGVLHLAYSYGKPVIASRVGDFEEFVHQDKTGFLFEKNNSSELAEVLVKAFESKEKLKTMGETAKKINNEQYTWDTSAVKLKEVYQNISFK